jgi:hypothetical protein
MSEIGKTTQRAAHKKQTFWQIWFPLILALLIVTSLCVFTVLLTTRDASGSFNEKWAGISIVFLSIPTLIAGLFGAAILAGLIYLAAKLLYYTPIGAAKLLEFITAVRVTTRSWQDAALNPLIGIKSRWSGLTALFRKNRF